MLTLWSSFDLGDTVLHELLTLENFGWLVVGLVFIFSLPLALGTLPFLIGVAVGAVRGGIRADIWIDLHLPKTWLATKLLVAFLFVVTLFAGIYQLTESVNTEIEVDGELVVVTVSNAGELFYFSCVTITTLGYGEMTPANGMGRFLACLEVIAGLVLVGLSINAIVGKSNDLRSIRNDKIFMRQISTTLMLAASELADVVGEESEFMPDYFQDHAVVEFNRDGHDPYLDNMRNALRNYRSLVVTNRDLFEPEFVGMERLVESFHRDLGWFVLFCQAFNPQQINADSIRMINSCFPERLDCDKLPDLADWPDQAAKYCTDLFARWIRTMKQCEEIARSILPD